MISFIKELFVKIVKSRLTVLVVLMVVLFGFLAQHLFKLQVVNGKDYLENYTMNIEKEIITEGARGNIYDRNGVLLAHNELSYSITLEDSGSYDTNLERAEALNTELNTLIDMIEANGDEIDNDFTLYMTPEGQSSYLAKGDSLLSFLKEVYDKDSVDDLEVNKDLGYDEASATPDQALDYLFDKYAIDPDQYGLYRAYQIMVLRHAINLNSYQKYLATTISSDVSDETVALIKEHSRELQGVEVAESTQRVYDYPEYFSHILGYTGKISEDEYNELSQDNDDYTLNDVVGKSGIEQYMEEELQGKKGKETVYVNNTGKVMEVKDSTEPEAGNDVYLSIDAELQVTVYELLEQELAGILYTKIVDAKDIDEENEDMNISIYDVYNALIENNVIDLDAIAAADSGSQAEAYSIFSDEKNRILTQLDAILRSETPYNDLSEADQGYITYIVTALQDTGVFDVEKVDEQHDEVYQSWKSGEISVKDYLEYAIESSWIDITVLDNDGKYSDTDEIYQNLVDYIRTQLDSDTDFDKLVYETLIYDDEMTGDILCEVLYEQGLINPSEDELASFRSGSIDAFTFMKDMIKSIQITPAQLALYPCTGSCVLMDPDTGELLACVTYPGYDTNKLTNTMDGDYYNSLLEDGSLPLYDNATQQTTAPGSTFKMVTAAAGLTEGVINTSSLITDEGVFDKLGMNLECWVYPANHGAINVTEALKVSCNYFFCEVGYELSLVGPEDYSEEQGLTALNKYATLFGLGDKTNIEIPESEPQIADEYPISAAIGQSNNDYTTVGLCRYVTSIANSGTVYDCTLLSKVTDSSGEVLETYTPNVKNEITELSDSTWDALHTGMREVVESHEQFNDLQVELAGKTGTAQESKSKPNHALFVGYAPMDDPEVSIAIRIANGYTSGNACDLADDVMKYYFGQVSGEDLLTGEAASVLSSSNSITD